VAAPAVAVPARATGDVLTRPVPNSDERLPLIGLGTFMTFDKRPGAPRDHLRDVLSRFWAAGGRVVDTSPLYGMSDVTVGDFAAELGITDRLFVTNKTWVTGEYLNDPSHAERQLEQSRSRLWRQTIDVMQVHSLTNAEMVVPILRRWKSSGAIRYLGVTHHVPAYFGAIEHWINTGDLDFVQVRYSIFMRQAEERILPAALDTGIAVLVNMPLEKARLHKLVESRRLPGFAAEIGCRTWAQFFLKYVASHPAVTCVLPATSNPAHAEENAGAMRGPLPDQAMRQRMVRHMETIPGFADLESMPWYPGKSFDGVVTL
jgi:diketogulonate reductase-like aldo/keto reductase